MKGTKKKATKLYWKTFLEKDNVPMSSHGNMKWQVGKWYTVANPKPCERGLHASPRIDQAIQYVVPSFVAQVEVKGEVVTHSEDDKIAAESMRIVKLYKWTKPDSLRFSIFCVKQSMKYIDKKKFPEVFNVCVGSLKAIDAVIANDTDATRQLASAAWSAAWSAAESAASAARSAARSAAWSAAWSAASAAWSAAWSAASAAWSAARSAAWSAAESAASAARSAAWSAAWSAASAASAARSAASAASAARSAAQKLQSKWIQKYVEKHCVKVLRVVEVKQ